MYYMLLQMGRDWSSVADKCCRGHYQPLLLLYANSWCEPIDTSTAPHSTYQLTDHRFYSPLKPGQILPVIWFQLIPTKHTLTRCWLYVGPASKTVAQNKARIRSICCVCWVLLVFCIFYTVSL